MPQYWEDEVPLICSTCGFCENTDRHDADTAMEIGWILTGKTVVDQDFVTGMYCSEECLTKTGKRFLEKPFQEKGYNG